MNRIDEEEDNTDIGTVETTVDQFPSIQSPPECISNSIYSSKQTSNKNDRSKYQTANRPSSLPPARHSSSSSFLNENIDDDVKQRRRHTSDSNTHNKKNTPALLVTSFLQHLRNELRTTTSDKKNDYHRHSRQKSSTSSNSLSIIMNSKLSNENLLEINDQNEILTLIDLLVLRVECLTNETKPNKKKKTKTIHPTVAEIDQNLIEYLYYLFTKFTNDDSDSSDDLIEPIIDKNNFVNVCQTLVRNGCFDIPSISPEQSISEATSSSDQTLIQEISLSEYHPDTEISSTNEQNPSITSVEQDTWLVVDLQPTQSEEAIATPETICILPTSISDEQLLLSINDQDKSYESLSSPSIYLSPNSSLIDLQNMVQEFDERNNLSINEDGSSSNVITTISNDLLNDDIQSSSITNNNIYTRLSNDDSSEENSEQMITNNIEKMSRREKKMQERWSISTKTDDNEQSTAKPLLGIDFPQISVLRRKFSSSSPSTNKNKTTTDDKSDSNPSTTMEEINTSPMTIMVDNTNPDQINELPSKDSLLLINADADKNNDDRQVPVTESDEGITMRKQEDLLLPSIECQTEMITNSNNNLVDDQQTNNENSSIMVTNPSDSNSLLPSFSSPPLISISPSSSLTLTTNENDTVEPLPNEKEEEKKEEEQRCKDDYNLDEEKKNNSSFVYDYHAPGIILINDEPTQTALLEQEKKEKEDDEEERERPSSPLPTLEQFNQQRTEDESPLQILSNDLNQIAAMTNIDENEARYKKVEIEEIPDDEETVSIQNIDSIEPTDFIHTDDELTKKSAQPSSQSNVPTANDDPIIKFDNVFSCYEKALSKVVDTYDESSQPSNTSSKESSISTQQSADDPIALRALQRFEERMNAAAAKTNKEETTSTAAKGKSSWSGSLSTPRKSLENLFKNTEQQLHSTPVSAGEELTTMPSSSLSDSYIRPRKTFDDNGLNYGMTLNLYGTTNSTSDKINNDDHELKEQQQQPSAIVENDDKRVVDNKSMTSDDFIDQHKEEEEEEQQQQTENETTVTNETLNFIAPTSIDNSLNTIVSQSLSTDQSTIAPYRFQIEGRRGLNTVERMRERRQSRESLDITDDKQQQIKNNYTLKPEEVQDPIIRRALERFDEKNRVLTQTKSMNYDEIQDPITRRALMRLESNLKRTIPSTRNDSNETWYTENYTLGSLQPTNDHVSRYTDTSQSPISNNKTKYISVHQHYCTPSSNDISDLSTTNEQDIPVMRAPSQSIYAASNNQPLSLRQRSRSEDMLTSRDLIIGQTTNLDDVDTSSQLQRNRSSNEIALNEPGFLLPNTLIKTLEPNFVRTTESSVTYATPTQTYSAYSCEYTRPRRNPLGTSSETPTAIKQESNQLPPPKYSQQQQNEIQRPTPYRPTQSSSNFAPIHSSTATTTSNYYGQQSLSTPSYSQQPLPTSSYGQQPLPIPSYSQQPLPTSSYGQQPLPIPSYGQQPLSTSSYGQQSLSTPSYSQQPLSTPSYGSMYTSSNLNQTSYSEDPIVRRALERFNSQMQNSLQPTSQYPPRNSYLSRQGSSQDTWMNSDRPTLMTTSTSSTNSGGGYQSIIGRRRQTRYDDPNACFIDNPSVGDAYASSLFANSQNPYPTTNHYMNMSDEPPVIPPRFRRENYRNEDMNDHYRRHSTDEYLSENVNNNNNNNNSQTLPRETFIHHAYPATITNATGFRPINIHYNQLTTEQDDLCDRAQSTSSTNSSDSLKQQQRSNNIRTQINNQQRLPPSSISLRTSTQQNGRKINEQITSNKLSPDNSQSPSDQTTPNNGNIPGDSVFHRLAYTGTKASLSRSSSNSCSNLLNKNSPQTPSTQLKSCEIDFDDSSNTTIIDHNNTNEQISSASNKYHRSKSVDTRTRLKLAQARVNNQDDNDENNFSTNDEQQKIIPSSKFTPVNTRRDVPPPRVPLTPTSTPRSTLTKRPSNGNNLSYPKTRTQSSNGNLFDSDNQQQEIENEENISFNDDNYQSKLVENRIRTSIPVHRYTANNNIQQSSSTSSVNSNISRTKPPVSIPINLDRRDSNGSITDSNRTSRRTDDNRLLSPTGQRRNVPVSVFSPAKLDNKRPAPAPPTYNYESQQQQSYLSRLPTHDNNYSAKITDHEVNTKTSTGNLLTDFSVPTDKHDNTKKMNVFERLFRGNKKKN